MGESRVKARLCEEFRGPPIDLVEAQRALRRIGIAQLGGKPAPAVGWGMGIERVLLLLQEAAIDVPQEPPRVFAVVPGPAASPTAMRVCEHLRAAGVSVLMHAAGEAGWGSVKAQFRRADASGAQHALIFGDDELARGEVALKNLRDPAASQRSLALADLPTWAGELLNA